jgi:hypothetical protein
VVEPPMVVDESAAQVVPADSERSATRNDTSEREDSRALKTPMRRTTTP